MNTKRLALLLVTLSFLSPLGRLEGASVEAQNVALARSDRRGVGSWASFASPPVLNSRTQVLFSAFQWIDDRNFDDGALYLWSHGSLVRKHRNGDRLPGRSAPSTVAYYNLTDSGVVLITVGGELGGNDPSRQTALWVDRGSGWEFVAETSSKAAGGALIIDEGLTYLEANPLPDSPGRPPGVTFAHTRIRHGWPGHWTNVVQAGDPAPGVAGGTFQSFTGLARSGDGHVAFAASTTTPWAKPDGIWIVHNGVVALACRLPTTPVNLPAGAPTPFDLASVASEVLRVDEDGRVAFFAHAGGNSPRDPGMNAILSAYQGSTRIEIRDGTSLQTPAGSTAALGNVTDFLWNGSSAFLVRGIVAGSFALLGPGTNGLTAVSRIVQANVPFDSSTIGTPYPTIVLNYVLFGQNNAGQTWFGVTADNISYGGVPNYRIPARLLLRESLEAPQTLAFEGDTLGGVGFSALTLDIPTFPPGRSGDGLPRRLNDEGYAVAVVRDIDIRNGVEEGTVPASAVVLLHAAPPRRPVGDLLIKRSAESPSLYAGQGIRQRVPVPPQIKINGVGLNEESKFQVQVLNDASEPLTFTLAAAPRGNPGWRRTYRLGAQDVTAALEVAGGGVLPSLVPGASLTLEVTMVPTNAVMGETKPIDFALGLASDPSRTIDTVEAVTEVVNEIVVNSTADLPQSPSVTCCCDTGRKLADGRTPECTLRAAIELANKRAGRDKIKFQIPSDDPNFRGGVPLIQPESGLPDITNPVQLDGKTQNPNSPTPPIELNGSKIPLPAPLVVNLRNEGPPVRNYGIGGWPGNPYATNGITISAADCQISGLVINQFPLFGVLIRGDGNSIQGCFVGTDRFGLESKANGVLADGIPQIGGGGILVFGSQNQIGGAAPGLGNLISGLDDGYLTLQTVNNRGDVEYGSGSEINIESGSQNLIEGNLIGTDMTGNKLIGVLSLRSSSRRGISVSSDANRIGGLAAGSGNTIVFNRVGVELEGTLNTVFGNHIGVGKDGKAFHLPDGRAVVGNETGVSISKPDNTIGGPQTGAGNIIAAGDRGIDSGANRTHIEGNLIGVEADGVTLTPSGVLGIELGGIDSKVVNNIIAGNRTGGMVVHGTNVLVQANRIFDNYYVFQDGSSGFAGGIFVRGLSTRITQNQIYGNYPPASLAVNFVDDFAFVKGISLGGIDRDDPGDLDSGANTGLNSPKINNTLFRPEVGPSGLKANVALDTSLGVATYTIEFFASTVANPTGIGDGQRYLGSMPVQTGILGDASGQFTTTAPVAVGEFLTATATDADGNTSEFSQAVLIQDDTSVFPRKAISDGVQKQVPGGNGQLNGASPGALRPASFQPASLPQPAPPATGDGNGDGVQDYLQPNVASFPGLSGLWITLASPATTALEDVSPSGPPDFANIPAGYSFPLGFVNFTVTGIAPSGSVIVTNFFHDDIPYDTVFAYGPTPGNTTPHWYEFLLQGGVGAQTYRNGFTLTFRDGGPGDHDLQANGQITTVLAAAYRIPPGPHLTLLSTTMSTVTRVGYVRTTNDTFVLATNQVPLLTTVLAWPASATNYTLQFTDDLSPTNFWRPVFDTPVVRNNQNIVTNTAASGTRFFRLRKF